MRYVNILIAIRNNHEIRLQITIPEIPNCMPGAVCCKAMNWLPSLRAVIIFAVLMAFFAAAYWACAGHGH